MSNKKFQKIVVYLMIIVMIISAISLGLTALL